MMLDHVVHFLGYMLFSSLDFFALYLLCFGLYNIHPFDFKKEIIVVTISSTFISYVFVMIDVYSIVPSLLITPIILIIMLRIFVVSKMIRIKDIANMKDDKQDVIKLPKVFQSKKWMYSILISIGSSFIYFLITAFIVVLFTKYGFLKESELTNSFSLTTYANQGITSLIGTLIASFLIFRKGGFGFIFKTGRYKLLTFSAAILMIINSFVFFYLSKNSELYLMLTVIIGLVIISTIIVFYMSYQQDNEEYRL